MECVRCTFEEFSSIYGVPEEELIRLHSTIREECVFLFTSHEMRGRFEVLLEVNWRTQVRLSISLPRYHFPHLIIVIFICRVISILNS